MTDEFPSLLVEWNNYRIFHKTLRVIKVLWHFIKVMLSEAAHSALFVLLHAGIQRVWKECAGNYPMIKALKGFCFSVVYFLNFISWHLAPLLGCVLVCLCAFITVGGFWHLWNCALWSIKTQKIHYVWIQIWQAFITLFYWKGFLLLAGWRKSWS